MSNRPRRPSSALLGLWSASWCGEGPQIGFWQNFVSLIRSDDIDGDLFAYSDRDDVSFPEKLARAEGWFEARPTDQPVLYFMRTG